MYMFAINGEIYYAITSRDAWRTI